MPGSPPLARVLAPNRDRVALIRSDDGAGVKSQ